MQTEIIEVAKPAVETIEEVEEVVGPEPEPETVEPVANGNNAGAPELGEEDKAKAEQGAPQNKQEANKPAVEIQGPVKDDAAKQENGNPKQ